MNLIEFNAISDVFLQETNFQSEQFKMLKNLWYKSR